LLKAKDKVNRIRILPEAKVAKEKDKKESYLLILKE
jgi:hypothetical protein